MDEPVRIDKWLWAARFCKTRAVAAEAVNGGRVSINGVRVKPSKDVKVGDHIEFSIGPVRRDLTVLRTLGKRGPAKEAVLLYEESEESIARREEYAAMRRLDVQPTALQKGRPTKRDRRRFEADRQARRQSDR